MAPRSRLPRNKGLPPNLYQNEDGYFRYRNPSTGQWFGLGRNKAIAVTQAIQANLHIQGEAVTLLDRITGKHQRTVNDWCDEYERKKGENARIKYLRKGLGEYILEKLEPLQVGDWLKTWDNKLRMRQAMLGIAKTVFSEAIGAGWIKSSPAEFLTTEQPKTRRDRLTLDEFKAIYAAADRPLQRAMELAIMTCARRENILMAKFSDIEAGHLHIIHIKAKPGEDPVKARYPLSMCLPELGWTLGDVIGRCRDNVVSKFLIHHSTTAGMAKAGSHWRDKSIEQMFRNAREKAGITQQAGKTPQTFHEIKSLAKSLWEHHGYNTMLMCGHKTEKMSALYRDRRGKEWQTVGVSNGA
jgi:integrase